MTRRRSIALTMVVGVLVLSGCATAAPGLSVPSGESTVFFEFDGGDQVNAVTVTTLDEPPYESCG
ncbi:hypothetical protein KEC56_06685 [Microbacterium sp. YMB-B2]|uniref:DUF192 domain-containing protein n=1 Tax=Microbacterium tenebrionis TaxID=2830665 RepID=A0A9X1LP23_9MICO|nr:hypothetical protein [Microbacterium tenebrionis]MCC2029200.1 hypothetical protein [Microbacterium tenebrionis]